MPSISPSQPSCGPAPPGLEVVFDLVEAGQHLRIYVDHGASQAGVLVLARGPVGAGASSQLDLALVEVFFEPEPLGLGDGPVLIGLRRGWRRRSRNA